MDEAKLLPPFEKKKNGQVATRKNKGQVAACWYRAKVTRRFVRGWFGRLVAMVSVVLIDLP
jgi:hypothetical protein